MCFLKLLSFVLDVASFLSLGIALPVGFRQGFCNVFGWSDISKQIGLVLGVIIGGILFWIIVSRMDDDSYHQKTRQELKALERRYLEKSAELERACNFLTFEQKQVVFSSQNSHSTNSVSPPDDTPSWKPASLHYCYIATVSLIISVLFFVLFAPSSPFGKLQDTRELMQSTEASNSFSHAADDIAMYWGSKNSDVIHKASCRYVKNIPKENRVYYKSVEDAEKDGRTPCSVCLGE